jgi:phage-related protein
VFSNRSEKETYSILHFLESHLGYRKFVYYYGGGLINENKVFYCPSWKHTFDYKDSNTIEATFVEIVHPVTPEF